MRRDADVADVDGAGERLGARLQVAGFHRGECARVIGADGVRRWLAGVAIEAARNIDGELLGRLGIEPVDGGVERWTRVADGAGAEEGIDVPGGVGGVVAEELFEGGRGRGRLATASSEQPGSLNGCVRRRINGVDAEFLQDGEVCRSVAAEFGGCCLLYTSPSPRDS